MPSPSAARLTIDLDALARNYAVLRGEAAGSEAAPVLKAWKAGGYDGAVAYLQGVIETVKAVTLLPGCRTPADLARAPRVIGSTLRAWQEGAR